MATWLITGCSSGLGRALAEAVLDRGHHAVVTARDPARLEDLTQRAPDRVLALALDVTDHQQVADVVAQGQDRFGTLDVAVNNAGYGYRAAIEEGDDDGIARLFATNVFGPVAVMKAVLPAMRERRAGTIVNISSIGAKINPPGSGFYGASKAALEALTGSLRAEAGPLGIHAMVVEPGAFRTDFAGRSLQQSASEVGDYAETAGARRKENDTTHGTQPGDPRRGAEIIVDAVEADTPPALLLLGQDAVDGARRILDDQRREIDTWHDASVSTAFPDQPQDRGAASVSDAR